MPTAKEVQQFQNTVWEYFQANRREMPWREQLHPYWIVVSEIMLQQTQVDRVRPKFRQFITRFPSFAALAAAPLGEVLSEWVGLGYNRRAKFLHALSREVMQRYNGTLPSEIKSLCSLPGIGPNTAGAVLAYAYNQPVVFVETNIRTVMLHHFFADRTEVDETEIRDVVTQVLDHNNPREWYWALMDYGAYLKKTHPSNVRHAKHYRPQSTFKGSSRQLRGQVIRLLATRPHTRDELAQLVPDERLSQVLATLILEKLITDHDNRVQLAE
jgi:A/G-specific adenine glycosylase